MVSYSVNEFIALQEKQGHLGALASAHNFEVLPVQAMLAGNQIHKLIQKEIASAIVNYQSEKFISYSFPEKEFTLRGRIDGFYDFSQAEEPFYLVEEIKSTLNVSKLVEELQSSPYHPYVLQAQLYAFICEELYAVPVKSRLLIVSIFNSEVRQTIDLPHIPEDIRLWIIARWQSLRQTIAEEEEFQLSRKILGSKLNFCFPETRLGQEMLLEKSANIAQNSARCFVQAPTGLGKTAGILFPQVKYALQNQKQVFFMTPRNSQHVAAIEFSRNFQGLRACNIVGKEKMCLNDVVLCVPDKCRFANNYYDKLKQHNIVEKLREIAVVDSEIFQDFGNTFEVCPFELSLDYSLKCDIVVCDYNYVISPFSKLARYFENNAKTENICLVVDEAHHLAERGLQLYSPKLNLVELKDKLLEARVRLNDSEKVLKKLEKFELKLANFFANANNFEDVKGFEELANKLQSIMNGSYPEDIHSSHPLSKISRIFLEFLFVWKLSKNTRGRLEIERFKVHSVEHGQLQILCFDASFEIRETLEKFHSIVAFSATFKPFEGHLSLAGFSAQDCETLEVKTPFPKENRKILLIPQVSTTLRARAKNASKIAEVIERICLLKLGNYIVYFPSFAFLNLVFEELEKKSLSENEFLLLRQNSGSSFKEQSALLKKFRGKKKGFILGAVQGGVYAEGIDLTGEALIGAFIVGPGLPSYTVERQMLAEYHEKKSKENCADTKMQLNGGKIGEKIAYVWPAMTKAVQAAGRVIRTPTDKGIIVLLDSRFLKADYSAAMPLDWFDSSPTELVSTSILNDVREFWQSVE